MESYNRVADGPMSERSQALLYYKVLSRCETGTSFFCHIGEWYGQYCARNEEAFLGQYFKYWNKENCYIPLNIFSGEWRKRWNKKKECHEWGFFREQKDVRFINGILLDFDIMKGKDVHYTKEEGEKHIQMVLEAVDEMVKTGEMVKPTLVTKSGRGLQMILLYKEPVSIEDEQSVFLHRRLYKHLTEKLQEQFDKDYIEVDKCVKDYSRICRLPGTMHTKNGVYAELQEYNAECYYEVGKLCEFFSVDLEEQKKEKKKKEKQEKKPEKKERKKKERLEHFVLEENVIPYLGIVGLQNAKSMLKVLEKLAFQRGMVEGQGRELMIFWYYNFCRQTTTAGGAASKTWQFNKFYFKEPLEEGEFEAVLDGVNNHSGDGSYPDGYYTCSRDTLAEELGMTEEEIAYTGIFKRREEKERARGNTRNRLSWKAAIAKKLEEGVSESEIVREFTEITGKSRQTIYNWVKEQKILSNFGYYQKKEMNRENTKGAEGQKKKQKKEEKSGLDVCKVVPIRKYTDKVERSERLLLGRRMVLEKTVRYYSDGTFVLLSNFTYIYDSGGNLLSKKDNIEIGIALKKQIEATRASG